MNYLMLACAPIRAEVLKIREENHISYPIEFLPENLHQSPNKLRKYLQEYLDKLQGVDVVLLPMGMCGKGTIGLSCPTATLVFPKCEDCITLMLSRKSLKATERPKYTYFFSEGWLSGEKSFYQEYLYARKKYGEEMAREILQMMYRNYKYFGYLETGVGNYEEASEKIKPIVEAVDARICKLDAPHEVLKKMILLELDENFAEIPPGNCLTEKDLELN